jgi:hypothetical protein
MRNWIIYDATRAFEIIREKIEHSRFYCENIRELFLPIIFQLQEELGGSQIGCNMFLLNCIVYADRCDYPDHFKPFFKLCLESGNTKVLAGLLKHQINRKRVGITRITSFEWSAISIPRRIARAKNPDEMAQVVLQSGHVHMK